MKTVLNITIFTLLLLVSMALAVSCSLSIPETDSTAVVVVQRYDSLQYRFYVDGDYSALQQMKTNYPTETRTLIENVLQLGPANSGNVSERMLKYFQDRTLQRLMQDVEGKYDDLSDLNTMLTDAFQRLQVKLPHLSVPQVYAQVGAFNESIIVGNDNNVGICLDKYMGKDYALYKKFYTPEQRKSMTRENIVPDCLTFYLLSIYQLPDFENTTQQQRDDHIACIHWVVNYAIDNTFFTGPDIQKVEEYMDSHKNVSFDELLTKGMK